MPNYFHLLLTIENEMTIERAVQFIKGGFSFRAGKELGMRSPIWQKGSPRCVSQIQQHFSKFETIFTIIR